jgi:GT2 family glycosyltransferase
VVIATRDRAPELARTLARLAALRPRVPVVVVDNGSADGTAEAVAAARAELPDAALLRFVELRRNAGSAARTVGAELAETELVAFCDDDSWWADGALPRAEQLFGAHPTLGLIAGRVVVLPGERTDAVSAIMAASPLGRERDLPGPSVLGFLACSAIVRRRPFLDVGGFSPLLHFYGEESLLAYDLAAAGWDLCYVDGIVAFHQPSAHRGAPPARIRRELRNAALTVLLRRPPRRCLRAASDVARAVARDPRLLPVLPELAVRIPEVLRRRQVVPMPLEGRIRTVESA